MWAISFRPVTATSRRCRRGRRIGTIEGHRRCPTRLTQQVEAQEKRVAATRQELTLADRQVTKPAVAVAGDDQPWLDQLERPLCDAAGAARRGDRNHVVARRARTDGRTREPRRMVGRRDDGGAAHRALPVRRSGEPPVACGPHWPTAPRNGPRPRVIGSPRAGPACRLGRARSWVCRGSALGVRDQSSGIPEPQAHPV
jgi:hypothetical protein